MNAPREKEQPSSSTGANELFRESLDDDLKMLAEEFDELSCRRCALEHAQQQAQDFDALTGPDGPMPEPDFAALDQQVEKLLHRRQSERRRRRFSRQALRFSKIAASFLVVALAGFTVLFFSVDAVKINVVNFIVRSYEVATQFHIEDMLGNMPEDFPELTQATFREPGYIPKGFDQTYYSCTQGHGLIIYERPDSPYVLSYSCMSLNTSISLDTEDCLMEQVTVGGNKAYLYTKYRGELKGHTSLIWHDGRYIYLISGPISSKEILKMGESLT